MPDNSCGERSASPSSAVTNVDPAQQHTPSKSPPRHLSASPDSPSRPSTASSTTSSSAFSDSDEDDEGDSDESDSDSSSSDEESAYGDDVFVPPSPIAFPPPFAHHLHLTQPGQTPAALPPTNAEKVERRVNAAKRKHRTSLQLAHWQRYGYAQLFPAIRQAMYEELAQRLGADGSRGRASAAGEEVRFPYEKSYAPDSGQERESDRDRGGMSRGGDNKSSQGGSCAGGWRCIKSCQCGAVSPACSFSELSLASPGSSTAATPSPFPCTPSHSSSYLQQPFPVSASIDHIHCNELSAQRFIEQYEAPYIPCMIQGLTADWNMAHYTVQSLAHAPYASSLFKCGEDDDGYSIKMKLRHFLAYQAAQQDDSPLYIFDSAFDEHSVSRAILKDFTPPHYFQDDLFHLLGEEKRPPYRWVAVGPERSGSSLHIDPLATSAWNTVLKGTKRWVLFPPSAPKHLVKGEHLKQRGEDNEAITYFVRILPRIKEEERRRYRAGLPLLGMREVVQYAGDTIFVPGGWWHAVLNLDDTIAVTQNYVSTVNFAAVWRKARVGRRKMSGVWMRRLAASERFGHLGVMAAWLNEEDEWDQGKERKGRGGREGMEGMKKRKDADVEGAESEGDSQNKKKKMSASADGQQVH